MPLQSGTLPAVVQNAICEAEQSRQASQEDSNREWGDNWDDGPTHNHSD